MDNLLLSQFWDLKTLAFQAKTSSTSNPLVVERESGDRGEHRKAWESSGFRPVFLQSGFQPTVEPTGFQPVVVQLEYKIIFGIAFVTFCTVVAVSSLTACLRARCDSTPAPSLLAEV